MRKHNEGYALPFVLVVMTVLFLIVTALLSFSLQNLQSQKNSIERMQSKYKAEGTIEMVVAQLSGPLTVTGATPKEAINAKIEELCSNAVGDGDGNKPVPILPSTGNLLENDFVYTFELQAASGSVQVSCEIELSGTISNSVGGTNSFEVTVSKITYKSYEIGGAAA